MTSEYAKELAEDTDGLVTYEYLANHIADCDPEMPQIVDNMIRVDQTGQFCVSAARYLAAIHLEHFKASIDRLVAAAIDKDRERRYIADLLPALYGPDYEARRDELIKTDDNFRRIDKRLNSHGV